MKRINQAALIRSGTLCVEIVPTVMSIPVYRKRFGHTELVDVA